MASIMLGAWCLYSPTRRSKEPAMALPDCVCGHPHELALTGSLAGSGNLSIGPRDDCKTDVPYPMAGGGTGMLRCQCRAYCPSGPIISERGFTEHDRAFGDASPRDVLGGGDPQC
jgi:hypothetical protein